MYGSSNLKKAQITEHQKSLINKKNKKIKKLTNNEKTLLDSPMAYNTKTLQGDVVMIAIENYQPQLK